MHLFLKRAFGRLPIIASFLFLANFIGAIAGFAFVFYSVEYGKSDVWSCIGLGLLGISLALIILRYGYLSLRTPFDFPIILFLVASIIGLFVSPDFDLSLGAFYTFLACLLFYYWLVSHPFSGVIVKFTIAFATLIAFIVILLLIHQKPLPFSFLNELSHKAWELTNSHFASFFNNPNHLQPIFLWAHGTGLAIGILASVWLGIALFSKRNYLRLAGGILSLTLLTAMVFFNKASILNLLSGASIKGRIMLWKQSTELIEDPLWGIGLGYYPVAYNSGAIVPYNTHPHNAYLQLYFDYGILGALAALLAFIIGLKLLLKFLLLPGRSFWYGLGFGVFLGSFFTAAISIMESAAVGWAAVGKDSYSYLVSPVPWLLAASLVIAWRKLKDPEEKGFFQGLLNKGAKSRL